MGFRCASWRLVVLCTLDRCAVSHGLRNEQYDCQCTGKKCRRNKSDVATYDQTITADRGCRAPGDACDLCHGSGYLHSLRHSPLHCCERIPSAAFSEIPAVEPASRHCSNHCRKCHNRNDRSYFPFAVFRNPPAEFFQPRLLPSSSFVWSGADGKRDCGLYL